MKNQNHKTPVPINYQMVNLIEQLLTETAPKGTALGLCDCVSAMASGYFIEEGGAVMPAVERYLSQTIEDEEERAARSRRAAKALTHGQYNLTELIEKLQDILLSSGDWKPTVIQGYKIKTGDFTLYKRASVKELMSKAYDDEAKRAVKGVSFGLMGAVGQVGEQRMAIPEIITGGKIKTNEPKTEMNDFYREVAKRLGIDELIVLDGGFSLVQAATMNVINCLMRLAKNCTFGKTPGKIPDRNGDQGRIPTVPRAEIVRPLARQHGEKMIPASKPDETMTFKSETGEDVKVSIWHRLYFLERHLTDVTDKATKKKLRQMPLKVIVIEHPDYENPLVLGTPIIELTAESMSCIYTERWPVEGIPQAGKYVLSGGGGRHYVHHEKAMIRLPTLSMLVGTLLKYTAATLPPLRTGFWDRAAKPTYGRLIKHLKKLGLPLSTQLFKKESVTSHLPVGYEAIRLKLA